jgi:fructuronate reductase
MQRLSEQNLHQVAPDVARPKYDRSKVPTRMVHLGAGAFHRSHQAVYNDKVMNDGDPHWGIMAVSLHSPAASQALTPQDNLYTLLTRDNELETARIIGSLNRVACLADARQAVLTQLAAPDTEIVSLTITEKGYCYDPATKVLDENHPAVKADLVDPLNASTAIGLLASAIARRRAQRTRPFTLLSCDNLPSNGKMLQSVVAQYLELAQSGLGDPGLQAYFLDQYACPCTVVDRITPAATIADVADVETLLGLHDASPIITEPFSQWVIQDWFSSDRPEWEAVGATVTDSVDGFERLKLRLLNGGHSAIAYLGGLAGYEVVADAMQHKVMSRFVRDLMDDAGATLHVPAEINLGEYKKSLLKRLGNRALKHRTAQIAIDGSQKLPQRIIEPMQARLRQGLDIDRQAMVIAAWIACLLGHNEKQERLDLDDPMSARLRLAVKKAGASAHSLVASVTGISAIFGEALPRDPEFQRSVTSALHQLLTVGVFAALEALDRTRP